VHPTSIQIEHTSSKSLLITSCIVSGASALGCSGVGAFSGGGAASIARDESRDEEWMYFGRLFGEKASDGIIRYE